MSPLMSVCPPHVTVYMQQFAAVHTSRYKRKREGEKKLIPKL